MSQKAMLAEFDAALHEAFASAGMADEGFYTPKGAPPDFIPVAARVYVDRDMQQLGANGQVNASRDEIGYVLEDVTPEVGGRLVVDGQIYINVKETANDGSVARWTVRRG